MEMQIVVLYEVVEPITNSTVATQDYDVAVDAFNDGCMVFEKHITTCNPEVYLQSRTTLTMAWHDNPNMKGPIQ